jgi:hypothetical protein
VIFTNIAQMPPPDIPPEAIEIIKILCATVVVMVLGIPIIRAFTKRWERGSIAPPPTSPELIGRLERIEQAVDSIAIEVERISESQRFVTKLMAEQEKKRLASGTPPQ